MIHATTASFSRENTQIFETVGVDLTSCISCIVISIASWSLVRELHVLIRILDLYYHVSSIH